MQQVTVNLGENSYPILIGDGLLADRENFAKFIPSKQVMIVTNETIAPLYLGKISTALEGLQISSVVIPDGEQYKTLDVMNSIISRLLEEKYSRDCTVIALGGGVVGDISGFAAACYQRGVNYIQVPTTILAQVDSSVGGKTAVNHKLGKNMIGAFYQPRAVISDIDVLKTLSNREMNAGLAEVIKYGLIRDPEFYSRGWKKISNYYYNVIMMRWFMQSNVPVLTRLKSLLWMKRKPVSGLCSTLDIHLVMP